MIHRLLREGDGTFKEDFLTYSYRGNILQIPQFKDDSSPLGRFVFNLHFSMGAKKCALPVSVLLQILQCLNKQVLCSLAFACSLGLLRLGSHVRALPGRTGRVLQGSQVRRRIRSSAQVTPRFWQGRHHCELFAPCECYAESWQIPGTQQNKNPAARGTFGSVASIAETASQAYLLSGLILENKTVLSLVYEIRNTTELSNKKFC